MNNRWHIFLKKERIRKRIYLSSTVNLFFEQLSLIDVKKEHRTPFVISYTMIFEQICLERITAVRSHMMMQNEVPFVTWKVKDGDKNQSLHDYLSLTNEEKKVVDELLNAFLLKNESFFTQET